MSPRQFTQAWTDVLLPQTGSVLDHTLLPHRGDGGDGRGAGERMADELNRTSI
jgi:hypothetical protein